MRIGLEIKIRNVDREIIARIDDLAKGMKVSRSEFLRRQLETIALRPEITECEDRYSRLVELVCDRIEKNNALLSRILDGSEYIFIEEESMEEKDEDEKSFSLI